MNFLVPAFLAGLAALAVPILLHLRRRDREKPQRFPSLMFLERLPIRTDSHRRITDWPLLLLRALVLALLAIAFARPLLPRREAIAGETGARTVIVLLDRSMSMAHGATWSAALDSARRILGAVRPGDRVAVVAFDDEAEVVQPLTSDAAVATAALARVEPTAAGTRFSSALRAARQIAADARSAAAEAVVITDLQRSGISGVAGLDIPRGLAIRTVGVAPAARANASVTAVDARRIAPEGRQQLSVQAVVRARGGEGTRQVTASLHVNGRSAGTKTLTVPGEGEATVAFDPVPLPAGLVRGHIAITPDALAKDDTAHFTVGAASALRVLLVAPDDAGNDELLYVLRALAIGDAPEIQVQRTTGSDLSARALESAAMVLLWDVAPPSGRAGAALEEWVQRGGGVAVAAGRRLSGRSTASSLLPARADGMADRLADRGGTMGDVRLDHPLFAPFRGTPAALTAARFVRYPRLDVRRGADVVARFDDGLPAVAEHALGTGRVIMVAMPLDARAGDFPLQPSYLPFVRRLALHASARAVTPASHATGDGWLLPGALSEPVVTTPSGSIVRPARDTSGAIVPLREAGIHSVYNGSVRGAPLAQVAANPPAAESDLAAAAPSDLLVGITQNGTLAGGGSDVPTAADTERKQGLWRLLIAAATLLLLAEMLFANRGRRGTAVPAPET